MFIVEEDIHLIRGLGIWGLQEAARLRQRFAQLRLALGISLNIGARHFLHPAFLDDLEEHCPQGKGITLEITETVALADLKTSAAIAAALKDRGFRLSMDDFGTGYSSLDAESLRELFRHTAEACPLGIWFAQKQGKYGGLPGFAEAKAVHERLHQLTPDSPTRERADLQRKMREITTQLYQEVAALDRRCGRPPPPGGAECR
ncbi:MAG: EAL domain-containing protein [Gammaproteobacteria bacterium]|nr:EAL domain-containing protein [Gammaproteobacteria bacterium]